jgi:hypothetical protein
LSDFKSQPFYNKLTPKFLDKVEALLLRRAVLKIFKAFEYGCLGLACLTVLLNYNKFTNDAQAIRSLMLFCFAGGLMLITNQLSKGSRESYDKAVQKVKDEMLFDICNCSNRCSCRQEFKGYLSKVHIDLSKKEVIYDNSKSKKA